MSDSHFLRAVARWLSILMLFAVLSPRLPAWGAESPAPAVAGAKTGAVVVDTSNNQVVISAGERDGIVIGTVFRIMRGGQEIAQVKVYETSFATANARAVSGGSVAQIHLNDRAEVSEMPPPRARSSFKFPWAALVGVGVLALVVLGAVRDKDEGGRAGSASNGTADISIK